MNIPQQFFWITFLSSASCFTWCDREKRQNSYAIKKTKEIITYFRKQHPSSRHIRSDSTQGVFQIGKYLRNIRKFVAIASPKILTKSVLQSGHSAPKPFYQDRHLRSSLRQGLGNETSGESHYFEIEIACTHFGYFLIERHPPWLNNNHTLKAKQHDLTSPSGPRKAQANTGLTDSEMA